MLDLDREQLRKTYQLCRTGFLFLAISLVPACIWAVLLMIGMLGDRRSGHLARRARRGTTGSSRSASGAAWWARCCSGAGGTTRAGSAGRGFLLCMCLVDLVLWFLDRGDGPGAGRGKLVPVEPRPGPGLGGVRPDGEPLRRLPGPSRARARPKTRPSRPARWPRPGRSIWMLRFCEQTNWDAGWPLQRRNVRHPGLAALPRLRAHLDDHPDPGDGPDHRRGPPVEPGARRDGARGPGPRAAPPPVRVSVPPGASISATSLRSHGAVSSRFSPESDRARVEPLTQLAGSIAAPLEPRRHPAGSSSRSDLGSGKWTFSSRT